MVKDYYPYAASCRTPDEPFMGVRLLSGPASGTDGALINLSCAFNAADAVSDSKEGLAVDGRKKKPRKDMAISTAADLPAFITRSSAKRWIARKLATIGCTRSSSMGSASRCGLPAAPWKQ